MHGLPDNKLRIKKIIRGYAMGLYNLAQYHAHACGAQSYLQKERRYNGFWINSPNLHACMLLTMGKGD